MHICAKRKPNGELGTLAFPLAAHTDTSTVKFCEHLHKIEANPKPPRRATRYLASTAKELEKVRDHLRGNPLALIADADRCPISFTTARDPYGSARFRMLRCVLE